MTEQKLTNYLKCRDLIPVDTAIRISRLTGANILYIFQGIESGLPNVLAAEIAKLTRRDRPARRA